MKKEKTEELFVKWMDGKLSPEEEGQLSSLFSEAPGLEKDLAEMKEMSGMVSREVPETIDPPYGDFFNSQLMRKVDLEVEAQRPVKRAERWWESLRWAWAPVGALALVLSFFAGHRLGSPAQSSSKVVSGPDEQVREAISLPTVYSAGNSLEAEVIADSDGEVSVIVVNGITAIRDDFDFGTVTSKSELPESYVSAEGRRFD